MIGLLLLVADALARAGGGEGFSGGGGSSSGGSYGGGGGGGDGIDIGVLIWLVFEHPVIGIPVVIVVVGIAAASRGGGMGRGHTTIRSTPHAPRQRPSTPATVAPTLDPAFSVPLFLDLARLLFVRGHEERGRKNAAPLRPFFAEATLTAFLARADVRSVRDIIVGTLRLGSSRREGEYAILDVRVEANVTEVGESGSVTWLLRERWSFRRLADTPSLGPDRMRALACPNCGSPADTQADGRCSSCDIVVADGRLQWEVVAVEIVGREKVPSLSLKPGAGVEAGTRTPTRSDADLGAQMRRFQARHPGESWDALRERFVALFTRVQAAWSAGDLAALRPHETDFLYQQHRYWLERYRAEGYRNRVESVRVTEVVPVRVTMDHWVEAVTVRIYATARDWTEERDGTVRGGSRDADRVFTEYWTLLRSVGATGKAPTLDGCPSCGAPLDRIGETGVCGYCEAKITGGDFDWVLSGIDQDDVYGG